MGHNDFVAVVEGTGCMCCKGVRAHCMLGLWSQYDRGNVGVSFIM